MTGTVQPYVDHITSEHADKPKFVAMVGATAQPPADLFALYGTIPSLYDLQVAVGEQLDVIGQWVGVTRDLATPLTGVYFALDTAGLGFDSGVWQGPYDPTTGIVSLPDDFYRLLIQARILNNAWDGTAGTIYNIAQTVFGPSGFTYYVEDNEDQTINIGLLGPTPPSPILTALVNSGALDLKPITITVASRVAQQGPVFAFDLNTLLFSGFDSGFWALSA